LVGLLESEGMQPVRAARHGSVELPLDVEDSDMLRSVLRPGILSWTRWAPSRGDRLPWSRRPLEIGFDLIDLSDSLDYSEMLFGLEPRITQSGIRVLTACSSISVGSAALIRLSTIDSPVEVSGFLVPAARHVAWPGTGSSLLNSVGRPIRIWQNGELVAKRGWSEARQFEFPPPLRRTNGYLFESADALMLPRIWPGLRAVDFFVSSHVPGFDSVFRAAARWKWIRTLVVRMAPFGLSIARRIGGRIGCLAYEIRAEDGRRARLGLIGPDRSYLTPVAPMVLAAKRIAAGRFEPRGLVAADQQVGAVELIEYLATLGVRLVRLEDPANPQPA